MAQKDSKNSVDESNKQRGSLQENDNKKNAYRNAYQKDIGEIPWAHNEAGRLGKLKRHRAYRE